MNIVLKWKDSCEFDFEHEAYLAKLEIERNLSKLTNLIQEREFLNLNKPTLLSRLFFPKNYQCYLEKIKNNKEALLLGLAYLERWYNFKYDNASAKDLVLYHLDFFGKSNSSALDNVISAVFNLATTLYGLKFVERKDIPVYHADVKAFEDAFAQAFKGLAGFMHSQLIINKRTDYETKNRTCYRQ